MQNRKGTRQQAMNAVRHLQRIVSGKSQLFLNETKARRKFPGLERADLNYLVDWLFMETGRLETDYSRMCKQLFEDFVVLLPSEFSYIIMLVAYSIAIYTHEIVLFIYFYGIFLQTTRTPNAG